MPLELQLALRRLWIQLTADPRRFWTLCAVLAVGLLMWARLIVVSHPPRMAMATEGELKPPPAASTSSSSASDNALGRPKGSGGTQRGAGEPIVVQLATTPAHDPFVISPTYFPKRTQFTELTQFTGKSHLNEAEEPHQIEARITSQLRALAERLKLEAAIGGSMAVINGRKYRLDDQVPTSAAGVIDKEQVSFTLTEVRQRSVILVCEGRQFEVQMSSPGS